MVNKDNTSGKKKFRFNVIDLIVILVIIAAIGVAVYLVKNNSSTITNEPETVNIEYTVEMNLVMDEFKGEQFLKQGDKIKDSVAYADIGEIISVSTSAAKMLTSDKNGNTKYAEYPNHSTITITVRTAATVENGCYTVNGYNIIVGKNIGFRAPNFTGNGYCLTIVEIDG